MNYVPPGIGEDVARRRDYRRIGTPEDLVLALRAHGYAARWGPLRRRGARAILARRNSGGPQVACTHADVRCLPGLLIPVRWGADGDVIGHELRLDDPPAEPGRAPRRYRRALGERPDLLDCPPETWARLIDPSEPLLVTEGIKKADALATIGITCVGILGVSAWSIPRPRDTTGRPTGPRRLATAWDDVPLADGRVVVIAFGSDATSNLDVHREMRALAGALRARGADVRWARVPAGADGRTHGIDDYLHAGGRIDDLPNEGFADTDDDRGDDGGRWRAR
jgi:hypothetical protein